MQYTPKRSLVVVGMLLVSSGMAAAFQPLPQGPEAGGSSYSTPNPPLPVEQVARNLQEKNALRAAALSQFNGTRVYTMHYRGFPR